MKEIPWWASSQNASLCEKKDNSLHMHKLSELCSFPDLEKVIVIKEANIGGEYFRYFGFFQKDPERYFTIFGTWDALVSWHLLKEGQYLTLCNRIWKVNSIQMHGFLFEFVPL
jgi:hypothetical protein